MLRLTNQRRVILEELMKVKTHPNASELYLSVRKRIPNISLGTIYRNLELMSREGKIMKINCDTFNRFDGNAALHPHFICEGCHRVFDVEQPVQLEFNREGFEEKMDSKIFEANIDFHGLCKNCKR
ncbi:MAG: Fur family transcriptional regulator [Candidatus Hydrothermarchaeaceae archaeon]